ncbi:hypothetical protein DL96DRAFT_1639354, partial [Flagelloscypha sp. PMI_526]
MGFLQYSSSGLLRPSIKDLYYYYAHPDLSPSRALIPFPDGFPNELLIYIVELAAERTTSTAMSLSMVSRVVQSIVDPVFFRDVHIGRKHQSTRMLKSLISKKCPPRLFRARNYILSVRATFYGQRRIGKDLLPGLFLHCPNLCYISSPGFHYTIWRLVPPPFLQTLGAETSLGLDTRVVDFQTSPFAIHITRMTFHNPHAQDLRGLPNFINLTHLFVRYTYMMTTTATFPWDVLVPNAPQMELVLIYLSYLSHAEIEPFDPYFPQILNVSAGFSPLLTRILNVDQILDQRFIAVVPNRFENGWNDKSGEFVIFMPETMKVYDWLQRGWAQGERVVRRLRD